MFWQERLEWIKQTYELTPMDLNIHWMQWDAIRANMQRSFKEYKVQESKTTILPTKSCHYLDVFAYLFDKEQNYWLELGDSTNSAYLYECHIGIVDVLLQHSFSSNYPFSRFAIIDKKYKWATYFTRSSTRNITALTVCGKALQSQALHLKTQLE